MGRGGEAESAWRWEGRVGSEETIKFTAWGPLTFPSVKAPRRCLEDEEVFEEGFGWMEGEEVYSPTVLGECTHPRRYPPAAPGSASCPGEPRS